VSSVSIEIDCKCDGCCNCIQLSIAFLDFCVHYVSKPQSFLLVYIGIFVPGCIQLDFDPTNIVKCDRESKPLSPDGVPKDSVPVTGASSSSRNSFLLLNLVSPLMALHVGTECTNIETPFTPNLTKVSYLGEQRSSAESEGMSFASLEYI
jgi:hypothetical protein